jgi:hypothetical protein
VADTVCEVPVGGKVLVALVPTKLLEVGLSLEVADVCVGGSTDEVGDTVEDCATVTA